MELWKKLRALGLPTNDRRVSVQARVGQPLASAARASAGAQRGWYRIFAISLSLPLSLLLVGVSQAEVVFDAEAYRQLADASSGETLAPGTEITARNWTKYK